MTVFVAVMLVRHLLVVGPGCPRTFLPVEDQGYFFVVIQGPDGAVARANRRCRKAGARRPAEAEPGVDIVGSISGLNFLTNAAQSNSAVEFAILKPWDERPASQTGLEDRRRGPAEADRASPGAFALSIRSALDSGPRRHRRLRVRGRGPRGARQHGAERRHPGASWPRRASSPSSIARQMFSSFSTSHAAVQLRPRPQQGEAAGALPARRVQHAADLILDRSM